MRYAVRLLIVLAVATLALVQLPGTPLAEDTFHQTAVEVLSSNDYQRELPGVGDLTERSDGPVGGPDRVSPEDDSTRQPTPPTTRRAGPDSVEERHTAGGGTGPVAKFLLWVLLAVGGILFFAYIFNRVSGRRRRGRASSLTFAMPELTPATETKAREPPHPPTILEKADALARNGEFAESIHSLLFAAIDLLRRRVGATIAPSSTSREFLSGTSLPASVKAALSVVVAAVEVSRFGGQAPNAGVYRKCRESFMRLLEHKGANG
ncbi:MAG: DUF4129 domain-containing protein [Proteobacteria bacterium]|nr:DUF4129 domain-containing protein [Pseudomonadota bacterium]